MIKESELVDNTLVVTLTGAPYTEDSEYQGKVTSYTIFPISESGRAETIRGTDTFKGHMKDFKVGDVVEIKSWKEAVPGKNYQVQKFATAHRTDVLPTEPPRQDAPPPPPPDYIPVEETPIEKKIESNRMNNSIQNQCALKTAGAILEKCIVMGKIEPQNAASFWIDLAGIGADWLNSRG